MSAGVPLAVDVAGRRVVAVGAGPVAAAKTAPLLDAGAALTVVAPDAVGEIREAAGARRLVWHARTYAPGDLAGAFLVVAATAEGAVNARVAADAAAQATFCVRTDRPAPDADAASDDAHGTAALLGTVRHGDFMVAVSTGGRVPAVARHVRVDLSARYGPEYGALVELLADLRAAPDVRRRLEHLDGGARRAAWRSLPMADILKALRNGDDPSARELALACLCSSSD
ncbi:MAG: NAD(P)-dependent oxidoreductase [Egibacteraceae bacterium]